MRARRHCGPPSHLKGSFGAHAAHRACSAAHAAPSGDNFTGYLFGLDEAARVRHKLAAGPPRDEVE